MQRTQQNNNYRGNYQNKHNKTKSFSYFLKSLIILAVFLIPASLVFNTIGLLSPETISKKVFTLSNVDNLEFCCMQKKKNTSGICSKVISLSKENKIEEIKKLQEKFYPISKKACRHKFIKRILINLLLMSALLVFLRQYRKK